MFVEENINADNYLEILEKTVIPFADVQYEEVVFQQDGAPAHYANKVRNLLNEKFPGTWIGRRVSIEWPARSPDLSPLDFFFWGVMKDRVYTEKFKTLEDLKKIIKREALIIANDKELLKKVCSSVTGRVAECIDANGGPFEQNR